MDLGRARNCDLELVPSEHDGMLRFSRPTSAAFRVAAYVEVLAARGVAVKLVEVDNPRRPQPAELVVAYRAAQRALAVPDVALDAGSHLPVASVLLAQFNVHAAVASYLLSPAPDPAVVDLAELFPLCPESCRNDLLADFACRYARKEVRMTSPASLLGVLGGLGVAVGDDVAPASPWELVLAELAGRQSVHAARALLDRLADEVSRTLDTELEQVLVALASQFPVLHEYGFYVPPDSGLPAVAGLAASATADQSPAVGSVSPAPV